MDDSAEPRVQRTEQELRQEEEREKLPASSRLGFRGDETSLCSHCPLLNRNVSTHDPTPVGCVRGRSLLHMAPRSSARGRGPGTDGASRGPRVWTWFRCEGLGLEQMLRQWALGRALRRDPCILNVGEMERFCSRKADCVGIKLCPQIL